MRRMGDSGAALQQSEASAIRKHPRFEARSVVHVHWRDSVAGRRTSSGICTDVAIGGMGLYMVADLAVGDILDIEFLDQPESPMKAEIVYRNGFDYGLRFLEIL